MENFETAYFNALSSRTIVIDKEVCPKLKNILGHIYTLYQNVYKILINNGAIKQDQYHGEQKIVDIKAPSSEPFPESQAANQMALRLSELDGQFDYLAMIAELNSKTITLKILKQITEVLRYIDWAKFNLVTDHYMTQSLTSIASQGRNRDISDKMLSDMAKQLALATGQALAVIKELSIFCAENYKALLIKSYFTSITFNTKIDYPKALEHFIGELKKAISRSEGVGFYRELATEAVQMLYGPDADSHQQKAFEQLKTSTEVVKPATNLTKKSESKPRNYKEPLFLAFFEVGRCGATFETLAIKLQTSHDLNLKYGLTFSEKLLRSIKKFMGLREREIYKTSFIDNASGQVFKELINFADLMDKIYDRIRVLSKFADNKSPIYKKINELSDQQAEETLGRQMNETRLLLTQCAALDDYFKKHTPTAVKEQRKGISIEISSIKRQLSRALELRHDYEAEREATKGLENLGL